MHSNGGYYVSIALFKKNNIISIWNLNKQKNTSYIKLLVEAVFNTCFLFILLSLKSAQADSVSAGDGGQLPAERY